MKRKIKTYLDASALWSLYYPEIDASIVEHVIQDKNHECTTSIWSTLELVRGTKKRENQGELTHDDAKNLRHFIETDIKQLVHSTSLSLIPLSSEIVDFAKGLMIDLNLYSSDAVQLSTAINEGCTIALVDDYHFKRLSSEIDARHGLKIIPISITIEDFENQNFAQALDRENETE